MASLLRHLNPYQLNLRSLSGPQYVAISDRTVTEQLGNPLEVGWAQAPGDRHSRSSQLGELFVRKRDHRHDVNSRLQFENAGSLEIGERP
jgi:hypothetical protein